MKRLGMPVSDDTILRHLKRQVARLRAKTTVRVAGIDDWSWRKGRTYGTIIVDLERREVVDVLQDRTTAGAAEWLREHPEVEIVSRDRCGLYAQGAREGAPQARQIADRFHLLQNFRETIEAQLSRADGVVTRTEFGRVKIGSLSSGSRRGGGSPRPERLISEDAERAAGCEMALDVERVLDGGVNRQELLG